MYATGYVKDYHYDGDDTVIEVVISGERLKKLYKYTKDGDAPLELRIDDGRTITNDQRKKVYATVRDISEHLGYPPEALKEILKYIYMVKNGCDHFSFRDCSVETARSFINTLLEFALEWNVPLRDLAMNRTDDMAAWLILAYHYKRCCICGNPGETHHIDAIGMGRDRKAYDDVNNEVIQLCRKHHTEAHTVGAETFCDKYLVFGIKKKYLEGE